MIGGLSWIAIKAGTKKTCAWIKKNWQLFVGISIPIILYLLTRKSFDLSGVLQRVNDDYRKEIDVINESREKEREEKKKALDSYFSTIEKVEKKYQEQNKELSKKQKKEIQKLLSEHKDSPEELTNKISELTGIKIDV